MDQHGTTVTQFVMEASVAKSIAGSLNLSVLDLLPHLVHSAQSLARPPISNFHVGAVGLGSDARVFVGVNLEFPGVPLHHSVHAEQFLLTNLAVHGCPGLRAVAVSAAPCGHCRQFYQELRRSFSLQLIVTDESNCVQNHDRIGMPENKTPNFLPLLKFLPNPFGPHDLLDEETPLLLEPHHNGLDLLNQEDSQTDNDSSNLTSGFSNDNSGKHENNESLLKKAALEAANNAHAPYSGCPSGVALMDREGKIYKGSYVESAAYNPSLGPVQAALVAYVARGGGDYDRIVAAALVESKSAKVRQEDTSRLLLKVISPDCDFRVYYCQSAGYCTGARFILCAPKVKKKKSSSKS